MSAIITIYGLTKQEHDQITAGLSASGGWGSFGASVGANLSKTLNRAAQNNELSIQIVATGGSGLAGLAGLLQAAAPTANALDSIEKSLGDYLLTFHEQNAAPIGYHVTNMAFAGWNPSASDLWTDYKETVLRDIVSAYRATSSALSDAQGVLAGTDPRRSMVPKSKDPNITELITEYKKRLGAIAAAYSACKKDGTPTGALCVVPKFSELESPIPPPPLPPVSYFKVEGWDPIKTRAFMDGVYLYNQTRTFPFSSDDPNYGISDSSTDLNARLKSFGLSGGVVSYEIYDPDQVFQAFSVKMDGTSQYQDIQPLGTFCCYVTLGLDGWYPNLKGIIYSYISADLQTLKVIATMDHSAAFAIHVTDKLGRSYYLPFARGVWHRQNRQPPAGSLSIGGYPFDQKIVVQPVL